MEAGWQLSLDVSEAYAATLAELLETRRATTVVSVVGAGAAAGDAWRVIATFREPFDPLIIDAVGAWLAGFGHHEAPIHTRALGADVWQVGWRAVLGSMALSPRLWLRPPWVEPTPGRLELVLEPSSAFGVGGHPTTRGMLAALDAHMESVGASRVLDVGAGSGILAIAALLLGAGEAEGVEVDRAAVRVAQRNAQANGVAGRVRFAAGGVEEAAGSFDLVLANLYGALLRRLADSIAARCTGTLLVSGVQVAMESAVADAFSEAGAGLVARHEERGWLTLTFRRLG